MELFSKRAEFARKNAAADALYLQWLGTQGKPEAVNKAIQDLRG